MHAHLIPGGCTLGLRTIPSAKGLLVALTPTHRLSDPASDDLRTGELRRRRTEAAQLRSAGQDGAGARRREAITTVTREWLQQAWPVRTAPREGVALAAVGSLARGDSGPGSDLDLVLLHDGRHSAATIEQLAHEVWYPLWDSGVRLDHSVRTLAQCREVARADLVAAVGLLDVQLLVGDAELVAGVRSTLVHDWRADARRRLPELLDAVRERHDRYGEVAHLTEPDLKEGRGGLRDLTVIRALTAAWLADRPRGPLDAAYARLLDVRDALHLATGRGRDKLVRQEHDGVAALLGHPDADVMLAQVSDAGRIVAHSLDATTRRAGHAYRARSLRVGPRRPTLTPLGHGISSHDGEIVLGPRTDPSRDPLLLLRVAQASARTASPIAPTTLDNLLASVPPLPRPWPAAARDLFGELLAASDGLAATWESLTLAGVIEQWIPQWSAVRSRPQHNPVHRHTVDRHQIQTVIEARPLLVDVRRPDLLMLACLLHDLGKADGGEDHARVGAEPAREAVLQLGFCADDAALVARLVRHHLTLVELATRRDPQDPRTVDLLREAVDGDPEVLELLRALTEADARAAGPVAWSAWRARLVQDLTDAARQRLIDTRVGGDASPADGAEAPQIPPHLRAAALDVGAQVRVEDHAEGQLVEVVAPDRLGLFADTAGLLAAHGLTVRRARLHTVDGLAIDRWYVESHRGARAQADVLERALIRLQAGDRRGLTPVTGRGPRAPGAATAPVGRPALSRALLQPNASQDATVLELRAEDRVGLLYDVARCLADAQVSVRSAHVATFGGQAVDTVYLTETDGSRLEPGRVALLVGALIDAADGAA